jgi:hypothetical protein
MNETDQGDQRDQKRRVLGILGSLVIVILTVPAIIYSIAPAGPIREGDVIYANGRHEVWLHSPQAYRDAGYGATCFLERRDALLVVQKPSDRSDGLLLSTLQGRSRAEPPFCPPHSHVLVRTHQIVQKGSMWENLKTLFRNRS